VKYLLRKCEIFADANVGKFHFTSNKAIGDVRYFTISARKLFHIRHKPNISLKNITSLAPLYVTTPKKKFKSVKGGKRMDGFYPSNPFPYNFKKQRQSSDMHPKS